MQSPSVDRPTAIPLGQRQKLLLRLLRTAPGRHLERTVAHLHPADVAPLFPLLKPDEQANLLELLFRMRLAGHTLSELDPETLSQVLDGFPDSRLAIVIERMPADDAVDLLEQLDPERRQEILSLVDRALASRLNNLLVYGDSTAGGIMDPDVVFLRAERTVAQTLEVLRELAESRRLFYLYVTDDRGHLVGLVKLWRLLTADGSQTLREVMVTGVITVDVNMPQEEVAKVFARYDLPLMPVLDESGLLVGVITVDDVIDVIEEEASEDLYRLGGLPEPESLGSSFFRSLRLRAPWLGLSLLGALLAALVIGSFEPLIARYAVLVAFMHVIGATGGEAARQTLTVVTAAMATGEMDLRRQWKVVGRQTLIGGALGLLTGAILGLVAWLTEGDYRVALIVALAQLVNQTVAALLASALPLGLKRIGQDPTLGTSNLVLVLADWTGFLLFLSLASWGLAALPAG